MSKSKLNPEYQQNLERDAKLVAAGFRGEMVFIKVAHSMGLWTSPQEAVNYAKKIREQPQDYRHKVGKLATQLINIAGEQQPPPKIVTGKRN